MKLLSYATKLWGNEKNGEDLKAWIAEGETVCTELHAVLQILEHDVFPEWIEAAERYAQWSKEEMEPEDEESAPCYDGKCFAVISQDQLKAWLFTLPPVGDGRRASPMDAQRCLEQNNICHGVIPGACESSVLECFAVVLAAQGERPCDGQDGVIEELYPREIVPRYHATGPNDIVNFKELNWLQTVTMGDVICKITPPIPGTPGCSVTGQALHQYQGKLPPLPMGKNLKLSKDGTQITTQCEGRLRFVDGCFCVDTSLVIYGNVDQTVGNIVMPGDVTIKGSVESGFLVYAKGNLHVEGVVEKAYLSAQGDVTIKMGVKGDGVAVVESGGDLRCSFVENATLRAHGSITAEYIINSSVQARRNLFLTNRKGTLVGGTIQVGQRLEARVIGNTANRPIEISLGLDPDVVEEIKQYQRILTQLQSQKEELTKDIGFLESKEELEAKHEKRLQQLKFKLSVANMHAAKLEKKLEVVQQANSLSSCELRADCIYPPLSVSIGDASYQVHHRTDRCTMRLFDGVICMRNH